MHCSKCQAPNREGRHFCARCGEPLPVPCSDCGFANQRDDAFCGGCGASLHATDAQQPARSAPLPEGERRQVTVLFADLAGYTEMTREIGAEVVHEFTARFFERVDGIVEEFGGSVERHIGDCVMAVFGAPVAHDNDPQRAIRAALAIQDAVPALSGQIGRPVGVHIGVASGQVVTSGILSGDHQEYAITGDSVNLASRLTDAADTGTTLISDAIRRMLAEHIECARFGALTVKGFAEPITAWQLLGLREAAGPSRRPFVGRRAELNQFRGALSACLETGCGQTVFVRGEAGIGKTRLVEEFQRWAIEADVGCHSGLVLDFGAGTGQDAIRALVHSLLGLKAGSAGADAKAAAEHALAEGLVAADRQVHLYDLLDLAQPTALRALYDAMDNAARNRGKSETIAELVTKTSERTPLVLVVEDIHWADRSTLDHLAQLAWTVAACRALLVMTSRIEGDPVDQSWRSTTQGAPVMTIDLGPLRPRESEALASAYLEASMEFARRCIERAAGNPLFLEQLLRHAETNAEGHVPGSVQSLVQARMDQLDPLNRHALQAASIFGQRFSLEALTSLIDKPNYSCGGLVEHFLIRPQGGDFLFAHALIRDCIYESLLSKKRQELHRRAAAWFAERDPVLHAEHLDLAEDPAAAGAYLAAAEQQTARYHHELALRLCERGLERARVRSDQYELTCLRGRLLHDLGQAARSIDAYEAALALADTDVERCKAWIGEVAGMRVVDRHGEALKVLDLAESAAVQHNLAKELAQVHYYRGSVYFPLGNIAGVLEQHELALAYAQQAGSPEDEANALNGLGDAYYIRAFMNTAYDYFKRCVALSRKYGLGRVEVASLNMRAATRYYRNDFAAARKDRLDAAEAAAKVGNPRANMMARAGVAGVMVDLGDLGPAKQQSELALEMARQLGARRFETMPFFNLARIAAIQGCYSEAAKLAEEAVSISRDTGVKFLGPWALGVLALVTTDPNRQEWALAEGEKILGEGCAGHNHLNFFRDAMEVSLNRQSWDRVERYATALAEYTRAEPLVWSDFHIARGRALAAHGRGERDDRIVAELRRLRDEARGVGLESAMPSLERALDAA